VIKHIVILGPAFPYRGGIAATNERLAQEFENSGLKVTIYTFKLQYPSILFPGKTQYLEEKKNIHLQIYRKVNSINPFNWYKVGQELKRLKPDLIIVRYWIPFLALSLGKIIRLAKRNNFTKIVSIVDNYLPHERKIGDKILSKYFLKAVDGCVVMSQSVKSQIENDFPSLPIEYCPHPLFDHYGKIIDKYEARKYLQLDINKNYILFFGLIRDYKGLDLLIEAVNLSRDSGVDFDVIVAGEFYSDKEKYINLINKYNLSHRFHIFDYFIPESMVSFFFCSADVIVQPYKDATQSGVTQIAYHFNKPMIITNVGGLAEIIPNEKVGYVVNPNSKEIADAIVKFYKENKEKAFSEAAKVEKNKYSWKRMEETIYTLYGRFYYKKETYNG
jgi:glycosyltransferase involved in cell wall biosynthesis